MGKNHEKQAAKVAAANAAAEETKTEAPAAPAVAAKITSAEQFNPVEGKMPKLKRTDFAKESNGTALWFQYQMTKAELLHGQVMRRLEKAQSRALAATDPKEKLRQQIAAAQAKLAALEGK